MLLVRSPLQERGPHRFLRERLRRQSFHEVHITGLKVFGAASDDSSALSGPYVWHVGARRARQATRGSGPPAVLAACGAGEEEILASNLPEVVELAECPVRDRKIVDKGVEAVLPPQGWSVHAESLNVSGPQELVISHLPDGTIEFAEVGADSAEAEEQGAAA